jgi:hypothetical protein
MFRDRKGVSHHTIEAARLANERYEEREQAQLNHEEVLRAQWQTQQLLTDQNDLLEKQAEEAALFHEEAMEEKRRLRLYQKKSQANARTIDWLGKSNNEDRFRLLLKKNRRYLGSLLFAPAWRTAIEASAGLMVSIRENASTLVNSRINLKMRIDISKKCQAELEAVKHEIAAQSPACAALIVLFLLLGTIGFGAYRLLDTEMAGSANDVMRGTAIALVATFIVTYWIMWQGEKKVGDLKARLVELQAGYASAEYQRQVANNLYANTKEEMKVLIESWTQLVRGDVERSVAEHRESETFHDRFCQIFEKAQRIYPGNVRVDLAALDARMLNEAMESTINAEWPKYRSRMFDTDMICLYLIRHGAAKDYDAALVLLLETGVEESSGSTNLFDMLTGKT